MSSNCIFCRIVDGELPNYTVYEDEHVQAFLDANPLARAHTLVVPKEHHARVGNLSAEVGHAMFDAVRRLATAVEAAGDADGTTIGINDGEAAGQEIPHVHGHLVPRAVDDGAGALHSLRWPRPDLDDEEFEAIADDIRSARG